MARKSETAAVRARDRGFLRELRLPARPGVRQLKDCTLEQGKPQFEGHFGRKMAENGRVGPGNTRQNNTPLHATFHGRNHVIAPNQFNSNRHESLRELYTPENVGRELAWIGDQLDLGAVRLTGSRNVRGRQVGRRLAEIGDSLEWRYNATWRRFELVLRLLWVNVRELNDPAVVFVVAICLTCFAVFSMPP